MNRPLVVLSEAAGSFLNSVTCIVTNTTVFTFTVAQEARAEMGELYKGIQISSFANKGLTYCAEGIADDKPLSEVADERPCLNEVLLEVQQKDDGGGEDAGGGGGDDGGGAVSKS